MSRNTIVFLFFCLLSNQILIARTASVTSTQVLTASAIAIKNGSNADETNNYPRTNTLSPAKGAVNKINVTVTAVIDSKIYDGTTASVCIPVVGALAAGDVVSTPPIEVFDNAYIGTSHVLTASGLTIKNSSGIDVTSNYTIMYIASSAAGVITKLGVTVTGVPDTKCYDGTTTTAGMPLVGTLAASDRVITTPTLAFDNANVGNSHVLTASGLTIKNGSGFDVTNNYTIMYIASPATGVITPLSVTVTAVPDTKCYDGTTTTAGTSLIGALAASDEISTRPIEAFDNANVGSSHVLTASSLTLKNRSNMDVTNNYVITYISSSATGVITPLSVNVTAVSDTKVYDGTIASAETPIVGLLATSDVINTNPVQLFDNATVGNGHVLTAWGLTIKNSNGEDVTPNYSITYVSAVGVITQATAVASVKDNFVHFVSNRGILTVIGAPVGKPIVIYNLNGVIQQTTIATDIETMINLREGQIYIIKVDGEGYKISM